MELHARLPLSVARCLAGWVAPECFPAAKNLWLAKAGNPPPRQPEFEYGTYETPC